MTSELALKPGDLVLCEGKRGTLVSIDSPTCVIQFDGAPASAVRSLDSVTKRCPICGEVAGHDHIGYTNGNPFPLTPREFSLDDLFQKINNFPESLQVENVPMLSKAAVLAQIVSAQQLTELANDVRDIRRIVTAVLESDAKRFGVPLP